jgi:hypothetical protein
MDDGLLGFTGEAAPVAEVSPVAMGGDPMDFMAGGGVAEIPQQQNYAPPVMPAMDMGLGGGDAMGGGMSGAYDPFQGVPVTDSGMGSAGIPEMTALREWEDKHERELEEMAKNESDRKKAQRTSASEELAKFYEERTATMTKRIEVNRTQETEMEAARMEAMKPGANPWERVVELIDLNTRTADESSDTSRMRSLLIQLKSDPVITTVA